MLVVLLVVVEVDVLEVVENVVTIEDAVEELLTDLAVLVVEALVVDKDAVVDDVKDVALLETVVDLLVVEEIEVDSDPVPGVGNVAGADGVFVPAVLLATSDVDKADVLDCT